MFDPFEKRISRDIRNQLSLAFLDLLTKKNFQAFEKESGALKRKAPDADHIRYIEERLLNYQDVCRHNTGVDPFETALLLWNHGLFFECHEWLEPLWLDADGPLKKAIQGIIRAAGAHVLNEAQRKSGSESSARKALVLIRGHRAQIPPPFNPDKLVRALKRLVD